MIKNNIKISTIDHIDETKNSSLNIFRKSQTHESQTKVRIITSTKSQNLKNIRENRKPQTPLKLPKKKAFSPTLNKPNTKTLTRKRTRTAAVPTLTLTS